MLESQVGFTVAHSPPPAACWGVIFNRDDRPAFPFSKAEDRHVLSRWCLYEIRISDHANYFLYQLTVFFVRTLVVGC